MGSFVKTILSKPKTSGLLPYTGAELFGWWDPSDSLNVTKSSGRFDQVNDKSGNGNHLTSAGSNRPFDSRTLNGLEVLDFQGGQYLTKSFSSSQSQPCVYILIFRSDVSTYFHEVMSGSSVNRHSLFTKYNDGSYYAYAGSNDFRSGTADPTNNHIYTFIVNGPSSYLYEDGILKVSGNSGALVQEGYTLGIRYDLSSLPFDGIIAENFMYNNLITNSRLNQTGQYLASKWGISYTDIT